MKVTLKQNPASVQFDTLAVGDQFILNDRIFMKIPVIYGVVSGQLGNPVNNNSILLETGGVYPIELNRIVHKVDCELIVPKAG